MPPSTKPRVHIHDFHRTNHQSTVQSLKSALAETINNKDLDGAIIIMTNRRKSSPTVIAAGRLHQSDKAIYQLARLQLDLVARDLD